ncbi:hypothetical protein [Sporosarcina sp. FSL K6-3457]|uniref:hypothetical protein n=1 Tax=Sporosarcina sp. FSL K6-3457 TaxID=2978204 RepID=UPI0030F52D05
MLTEKLIMKINAVLDSDLTSYRIAKDLGYASANPIHKLRDGESDIMKLQLATVVEFEKLYEEMMKMENIKSEIKGIITKVEAWEIGLVDADPNYHEIDYIDGASDHYIVHEVEGEELEVFFAEHDHVKELRNEIYEGTKTNEDFEELVINEPADQYDYDKVVAYRSDNGQIEWL